MIRFINCPKCGAQVEDVPGSKCWSCGEQIGDPVDDDISVVEVSNAPADYNTVASTSVSFRNCSNCGSQCTLYDAKCWSCGVPLEILDDGKTLRERKKVPFGDLTKDAPKIKEKKSPIKEIKNKLSNPFKPDIDLSEKDLSDEEKKEERRLKKERKLILFHCPECGDYFKVLFKKVQGGVKCPVCKTVKMKIPYFCTRCKSTVDYNDFGHHVCMRCKINMVPDPNFE